MSAEPVVAACAIMRNEADAIEEWLAYHILQGVSRIVLYDNDSTDDTIARARRFARNVDLEVVPWPNRDREFNVTQVHAYLDGTLRLRGRADFVAYIDIDEFLVPTRAPTLGGALAGFGPEISAIAVNQRVFGSAGLDRSTGDLVTRRFTLAAPPGDAESRFFKSVARPERVAAFHSAHAVVTQWGAHVLSDGRPLVASRLHPGHADEVAQDGELVLHHYILKSREEFEAKKRRWSAQSRPTKFDNYFEGREGHLAVHGVREERLLQLAPRLQALIDEARAGA